MGEPPPLLLYYHLKGKGKILPNGFHPARDAARLSTALVSKEHGAYGLSPVRPIYTNRTELRHMWLTAMIPTSTDFVTSLLFLSKILTIQRIELAPKSV